MNLITSKTLVQIIIDFLWISIVIHNVHMLYIIHDVLLGTQAQFAKEFNKNFLKIPGAN